jgi:hypothetical protein
MMTAISYLFTKQSQNAKTGPLPVVMASASSCPSTCKMLGNGCYAESGPTAIHWRKLPTNDRALDLDGLCRAVKQLPRRQLWRYGTAGDLPSVPAELIQLDQANGGRPVIAYTHRRGADWYALLRTLTMNVNLSADSVDEADELAATGLPVVVVLPSTATAGPYYTPAGRKIAVCPATQTKPDGSPRTTCALCQVCSKPRNGGVIIGFPAHGARKNVVNRRLSS